MKKEQLKKRVGTIILTGVMLLSSIGAVIQPVSAATGSPDLNQPRSLTIHKYRMDDASQAGEEGTGQASDAGNVPENAVLLQGVQFKVDKVNDRDHTQIDTSWQSQTLTTNVKGEATIAGNDNLPMGVYRVEELDNPAVTLKAKPFYVSVPLTNPEGDGWIYDVHVYPKNEIAPGPDIDKDVTEIGNKDDTADISESVKWIIQTTLPDDVATCKNYTITDTLDERLDYVPGSVQVYRVNTQKERVLLPADCYTLTEPSGENGRMLTVMLSEIGRQEAAKSLPSNDDVKAELHIEFQTILNEKAEDSLGEPIYNDATIDYTNNLDVVFEPKDVEEEPEVHTGGVNIMKVSRDDHSKVLSDAKFKIYRTEADAKANINAVKDPKNTNADWEVTTDGKGIASFKGLAYGEMGQKADRADSTDYWIVETQAPIDENGKPYNLLKEPVKVTVNATSHLEMNTVMIENVPHYDLPNTGASGNRTLLIAGGVLIVAAAGLSIVLIRRRKRANATDDE